MLVGVVVPLLPLPDKSGESSACWRAPSITSAQLISSPLALRLAVDLVMDDNEEQDDLVDNVLVRGIGHVDSDFMSADCI